MDDPWANAWGDPSQPETAEVSKGPAQLWAALQPPINGDDKEADIAIPSWSTGTGVHWDTPSNEESLWTQPVNLKNTWEPSPSPYEHLSIGKSSNLELELTPGLPSTPDPSRSLPASPRLTPTQPPEALPTPEHSPPTSASFHYLSSPPEDDLIEDAESSPHSSPKLLPSRPASSEGFGTFESAVEERPVDLWTPSATEFERSSIEDDNWGSAWETSEELASQEDTETGSQPDEWETARKQKELRDQRVPPEVLALILSQTQELINNLWPGDKSDDPKEPKWSKERFIGLDVVEGLRSMADQIVPRNLILSQPVQFKKTAIAKGMVEALRLTRNTEIMARSPLALYMGAKGSTAWEASLKTKPNVVLEEEVPAGWKIVEKEKEPASPLANEGSKGRKPGGGLLSFWGKKQPASAEIETKIEVRKPSPVPSKEQPTTNGSETSVSRNPSLSGRPPSINSVTSPTNNNSLIIPSTSAVPSPVDSIKSPQSEHPKPTTPPPSVVSRFLNRFSRTKGGQGPSNRNSLALSSNDLEFLSDIVPTAGDGMEDDDFQLKALSSMIHSSPLPEKLPSPLAPPPKAPPVRAVKLEPAKLASPASSNGFDDLFSPTAPSEQAQSSPSDFDAFFDTLEPISDVPEFQMGDDLTSFYDSSPDLGRFTTPPIPPGAGGPSNSPSGVNVRLQAITAVENAPLALSPPLTSPTVSTPIVKPRVPFNFPRTPGSRPETPVRAPAPRAIMSSSEKKAPSTFFFPPPPASSRSQTPLIPPPQQIVQPMSPSNTATSSPSPSSQTFGIKPPPSIKTHSSNLFHADDFAEFSPIPPANLNTASLHDTSFTSSISSNQNLFNSGEINKSLSSDLGFDDFDDFVSSVPAALRTPSPPQPPAKSSPAGSPSHTSVPSIAATGSSSRGNLKNLTLHQRRASQAMEHQRTRSLVESAAMRVGQWPAPPTPLPDAIPPPGASFGGGAEDLLSGDSSSSMGREQENAFASLRTTALSPLSGNSFRGESSASGGFNGFTFPPPPTFKFPPARNERPASPPGGKMQSPTRPFIPASAPLKVASLVPTRDPPPSTGTRKGGLSASDLSFFEGL